MNLYCYNNFTIEVFNDPTYEHGSADNNFNYLRSYSSVDGNYLPSSKHGVKIYQDKQEINSCIIFGCAGGTGISLNSSLTDNDQLLICCANYVFCLGLPDLELRWNTKADPATCFQIHTVEDDYIVHGELEISCISKRGDIKWRFGGADIFVSLDGGDAFVLNADHVELTDYNNQKYKVDFNGNEID